MPDTIEEIHNILTHTDTNLKKILYVYIVCCCFFPSIIIEMTISISCKRFIENK